VASFPLLFVAFEPFVLCVVWNVELCHPLLDFNDVLMIRQVQSEPQAPRDLHKDSFLRDVKEEVQHVYAGPP
jgi:hypothetical protein